MAQPKHLVTEDVSEDIRSMFNVAEKIIKKTKNISNKVKDDMTEEIIIDFLKTESVHRHNEKYVHEVIVAVLNSVTGLQQQMSDRAKDVLHAESQLFTNVYS
jgi:cell division ATPase FtsA